jgi:hypothetical protein
MLSAVFLNRYSECCCADYNAQYHYALTQSFEYFILNAAKVMPIFDFNSTVNHFYVDLIKMQFLLKQISTINNFLRFRKLFLWRHDIQQSDIQHNNT